MGWDPHDEISALIRRDTNFLACSVSSHFLDDLFDHFHKTAFCGATVWQAYGRITFLELGSCSFVWLRFFKCLVCNWQQMLWYFFRLQLCSSCSMLRRILSFHSNGNAGAGEDIIYFLRGWLCSPVLRFHTVVGFQKLRLLSLLNKRT